VLDRGVIPTGAALPLEARVRLIHDEIRRLIEASAPALLVLEDLYTEYRFPRTALLMAHARGVICLAASQCDVKVLALAPAEVKRAVAPTAPPRSTRSSTRSSGSSSSANCPGRPTSRTRSPWPSPDSRAWAAG